MNPARPSYVCASCARALRNTTKTKSQAVRSFTSTVQTSQSATTSSEGIPEDFPRWRQTVPAMKMPIRVRPASGQAEWRVNTSQEKLDEAIDRFIGSSGGEKRGRDLLDEETKWISTTHKSHLNGAQGFNDRLAFLGARILQLQCSLLLLSSPSPPTTPPPAEEVYSHPSLTGLENITPFTKNAVLDKTRLAQLATSYGLDRVVRWKPKRVENLRSSGVEVVMAQAVYAIVGAVAMKQGGEMAARVARERVLAPLGLR